MPRESSKCRDWEKERRNRLNIGFANLCKLLPCYDPAVTTSKPDILKNAAAFIEELQEKIKGLISPPAPAEGVKKIKSEEIRKLHERIRRLLSKNEQLCGLLRDAKISVPKGCVAVKRLRSHLYWSQRILPEQAKVLVDKELEKENDVKTPRKFNNKARVKSGVANGTPKHRKAILNRSEAKKIRPIKKKKVLKSTMTSKCVIVLSQPSLSQSCYVITNAPSSNLLGNGSTVITNSSLLTNPLVSSSAKPYKSASAVPSLGPGTLILANGSILPVLSQHTVLPVASQIINPISLTPRPPNPTVIFLPRTTQPTISTCQSKLTAPGTKTVAKIRPKYCLTRTTQVNKVPIPALTSRYANNVLVLRKSEVKNRSKSEKKVVEKVVDKVVESGDKRKVINEEVSEVKKAKIDEVATSNETVRPKIVEEAEEEVTIEKSVTETVAEPIKVTSDSVISEAVVAETTSMVEAIDKHAITVEVIKETTAILEEVPEPEKEAKKCEEADMKALELNINHSELSNDIFASLQVPAGCQNPESTSPTAAFLLAFPLVSSLTGVKVTEVTEEDNSESQRGTPTLLQIGTMETTKPTQSESLTPSLLNLDNISFFSSKDICSGFYSSFENSLVTPTTTGVKSKIEALTEVPKLPKLDFQNQIAPPQQKNLVGCAETFYNRNLLSSNSVSNNVNVMSQAGGYHMKQSKQNLAKNLESKPPCVNYSVQNRVSYNCNNNFNDLAKVCTTSSVIKSYPDPLYTNTNSYNYYSATDNNLNQNYYKNITKNDNRSYYSLNYENYSDYRKNDGNSFSSNYYNNTCSKDDKFLNNTTTTKVKTTKPPINWMTTPDNRTLTTTDYVLPQFSKENDFSHNSIYPANSFSSNSQTSYFNTNTIYSNTNEINNHQEPRKNLDLPLVPPVNTYQRTEVEENQFSWSPTKIPQFLDPNHSFVSSTLPTLVGDLALGNPLSFGSEQNKCQKRDNSNRRVKNYENNFLSVSQLVDHNKSEAVPARTVARRNSGNRSSKKLVQPPKTNQRNKQEAKEIQYKVENKANQVNKMMGFNGSNEMFCDVPKNRNVVKNSSSNYTAEALIGPQMEGGKGRQNYVTPPNKSLPVPPFLPENIIPYFPPVDLQQENNYMQQNQNYQSGSFGHNFTSSYNNSYASNTLISAATTITSTYLGTNNFMHDMGTGHDCSDNLNLFPPANKDKCPKNQNRSANPCPVSVNTGNVKKVKKKPNENLPSFVDFPFLSMPGSINSPILPDDLHSHTGFLQPPTPQLYPCKNPLYPATKQNDLGTGSLLPLPPVPGTRSNIQHPEISPSINNAGTSLTNFNLSTIFPEINKGADSYLEPRIKEQARSYSSTVQVTFNEKPNFSFSYINSRAPQSYNNP